MPSITSLSEIENLPQFDVLLSLGRGISPEGVLSPDSIKRTEFASCMALTLLPRVVVFSGGYSWQQAKEFGTNADLPTEGGSQLGLAKELMDDSYPNGVTMLAEEESFNTADNFANSAPLLDLRKGDKIGILTDELHWSADVGENAWKFGRIATFANIVFPHHEKVSIRIPNAVLPTVEQIAEETLVTLATKAALIGVRPGNVRGMMRRHRLIEKANDLREQLGGTKQVDVSVTTA